jgi:hypothetical protein
MAANGPPVVAAGGGISIISALDYLAIDRPDLFETESMSKGSIVRDPKAVTNVNSVYITMITIAISAFIFITLISWFSVIQAWVDSRQVNPDLWKVTVARMYYSIIATLITIIAIIIFLFVYRWLSARSKSA